MNTVSKFVAVLIALLLLFIYPAKEAAEKQDDLSRIIVYNAVTQFVDAVRNKGFLTPVMYQDFINEIEVTGNVFDIQMEHQHKKYQPDYTDAADPSTFQDQFDVWYEGFYSEDIMMQLFPEEVLDKDSDKRKYRLAVGDFFKVSVKNTNRTAGTAWFDFITGSATGDPVVISAPYGGMVLNEDY
ncbi:hypothetical protein [Paenibacillus pini]|uniref:Uncharacterized protein n=1 Tax=Paenibacillus pini JCM 16418 TaxID=1236976 RepID=W7YYJ9_9BACL|nr:hypothetical protein [Paenibacillus pini]GAF07529.1 hypothetical protein JCM16418_1547 [Paenibacillus pini JCM 16418]